MANSDAVFDESSLFSFDEDTSEESFISIECGEIQGNLSLVRFNKGRSLKKGAIKCVIYEEEWHSLVEFEQMAGKGATKNWKKSILYQGKQLGKVINSNGDIVVTPDIEGVISTPSNASILPITLPVSNTTTSNQHHCVCSHVEDLLGKIYEKILEIQSENNLKQQSLLSRLDHLEEIINSSQKTINNQSSPPQANHPSESHNSSITVLEDQQDQQSEQPVTVRIHSQHPRKKHLWGTRKSTSENEVLHIISTNIDVDKESLQISRKVIRQNGKKLWYHEILAEESTLSLICSQQMKLPERWRVKDPEPLPNNNSSLSRLSLHNSSIQRLPHSSQLWHPVPPPLFLPELQHVSIPPEKYPIGQVSHPTQLLYPVPAPSFLPPPQPSSTHQSSYPFQFCHPSHIPPIHSITNAHFIPNFPQIQTGTVQTGLRDSSLPHTMALRNNHPPHTMDHYIPKTQVTR